ncbi:DUF6484 domain-containing protein [Pseudorhodoferax sp. Leaf265]|uniref:DUF6484 domain-containing protein n=1 Tax=Pseudorhodoferax sp. Leaf265 TaxID=1736315 RepID=UPI0006F65D4D|nr:DUF6484 domain-containing protein [Pseudorhodoferax sp. Leaf265]KQP13847.1 hypothetical protein ASF45_30565 [Pseudorhodoferax sp. Leaf265]
MHRDPLPPPFAHGLADPPPLVPAVAALAAVQTGRLGGFDSDDAPLLTCALWPAGELRRAQTIVELHQHWIGARVVFVLEEQDLCRPIVLGVVLEPGSRRSCAATSSGLTITADDQRIHLKAAREIVLECGAASITLTRAGKVLVKGAHLVSTSTGSNRIKGAVVDIN